MLTTTIRHDTRVVPALAAALAALLWLALAPATPDLAAQAFRAAVWSADGFQVYNAYWYGGHHLPGYSLVFPPLGALVGPRTVGAVAAVASAVLFARLAVTHFGPSARWGVLWFAVATSCDLLIGRITFGLGVTVGLGALVALQSGRRRLALALGAACSVTSPVAGAFVALAGVAVVLGGRGPWRARDRTPLKLAAAAIGAILVLVVLFPEGGRQPMSVGAVLAVVAFSLAVAALTPPQERVIRAAAILYALAGLASFVLATPMGSNSTRLGATFAGPVLLCVLATHGMRLPSLGRWAPRAGVALLAGLAVWQWQAPVREVAKGATDPSAAAAFHAPLLAEIRARGGPVGRVEVPFTLLHWEAVHLGGELPLARGWETQLDTRYNGLFYDGTLGAASYRRWLRDNGVRWVAVPAVPLDPSGRAEAALVAGGLPYLRRVWATRDWTLHQVRDPVPLAGGTARLTALRRDGFTLDVADLTPIIVRVRHTPYWTTASGAACVERSAQGWTRVRPRRTGSLVVRARFGPTRVRAEACPRTVTRAAR